MPSALTADTSSFVLLSDSGTTPSIYDKKFNGNTFSPFLKLEFTEDLTENSKTKAYFLSSTSKTYTYDLKNSYSSFLKIKTGFGFRSVNEWNYRLNIQRLIRSNEDFENSLDLRISKSF